MPYPLSIGSVTLTVHDLDQVSDFYERVIGLTGLSGDADTRTLGAGSTPLLHLRRDPAARKAGPREAGLFHTAFLLPERKHLARWLGHVAGMSLPLQGASDHIVSEAIYLADPEGNGIEVYIDRPTSSWIWRDGTVQMATDRLDIDSLMAEAGESRWQGAPEGTIVGHVHLKVGDLKAAEAFYHETLGMDVTCRYPGATFYSSGGYHHHLATNIWNSRNAPPRNLPATGLAELELVAGPVRADLAGQSLVDPWGTRISVRA
jgi:catechol 2,3-dioxygenase